MSNSDSYDGGGPSMNYSLQVYGKPKVYYGGKKTTDPFLDTMGIFYKKFVMDENAKPVLSENISGGTCVTSIFIFWTLQLRVYPT